MVTQILVPLDGSSLAEQALSCAMTLGRGLPAELVLFRAVSISPDTQEILDDAGLKADELMKRLEAEASDYLHGIADQLRKAGLSIRRVVQHGPAAEAIVDYAEQKDTQQIVMATHGYGSISRWRHGSVAERVLQSASVPVLLIRARKPGDVRKGMACRRILVPLDGSPMAEQVVPVVTSVARALVARIILFRVPTVHTSGYRMNEWYIHGQDVVGTNRQGAQVYLEHVPDLLVTA